ncbi:MAG TPA: TMEM165/GDT1 family protein [Crenotrichaceae bacterium]|nr:TMEM165/GDT1 family protein [Crenotrichaceae bacterium]
MTIDLLQQIEAYYQLAINALVQLSADTVILTAVLVFMAEIGDKSQIVCMTLAARHRGLPVLLGAVSAFAILNLLAVIFGVIVAHAIPELYVTIAVAILFLLFGIQAIFSGDDDSDEGDAPRKSSHSLFITTFLMIFIAEFGDKTQIAVAGLSTRYDAAGIWVGATLALIVTSGLAVWVGRGLLQRIPVHLIQRMSGVVFIVIGFIAVVKIIQLGGWV